MSTKKRSRSSSEHKIDYIKKNKEEASKSKKSSHVSTPIPKFKSKSQLSSPSSHSEGSRFESDKISHDSQNINQEFENQSKEKSSIKHNLADILEDTNSYDSSSQISRNSLAKNSLSFTARQSLGNENAEKDAVNILEDSNLASINQENLEDLNEYLPPTPPDHEPGSITYNPSETNPETADSSQNSPESDENNKNLTPLQSEDPIFRNADYSGMSINEQIKRSARRVKVLESGEEVQDTTWTEVKLRLSSAHKLFQKPISNNEDTDMVPEGNESQSSQEEIHQMDIEKENFTPEHMKSERISQNSQLRRSARLADKKSRFSHGKRKRDQLGGVLSTDSDSSVKKIKK